MIHVNFVRIVLIFLLLPSLCGCWQALGTSASIVGATASVCDALDCIDNEKYQVISKECLWYRPVKLSEQGKKGLTRDDKEQIVYNQLSYEKNCQPL